MLWENKEEMSRGTVPEGDNRKFCAHISPTDEISTLKFRLKRLYYLALMPKELLRKIAILILRFFRIFSKI
jgi:hypothetical protein